MRTSSDERTCCVRELVGKCHPLAMIASSENGPRWHNEWRQAKVTERPRSSLSCFQSQDPFPSMSCYGWTSRPARGNPELADQRVPNHSRMFFRLLIFFVVSSHQYCLVRTRLTVFHTDRCAGVDRDLIVWLKKQCLSSRCHFVMVAEP